MVLEGGHRGWMLDRNFMGKWGGDDIGSSFLRNRNGNNIEPKTYKKSKGKYVHW